MAKEKPLKTELVPDPEADNDGDPAPAPDPKIPRYKLLQDAYIDLQLLSAGVEIGFTGVPGHHMRPLNPAAKAMFEKHKPPMLDPINDLSINLDPPTRGTPVRQAA